MTDTTDYTSRFTFYRLVTALGTWLVAGESTKDGYAAVDVSEVADRNCLVLCVPNGFPQNSFLIAADGRPITLHNDTTKGEAISGRLLRDPNTDHIMLVHPVRPGRFLGIVDAINGLPVRVFFDRLGDSPLDYMTLHPISFDVVASARTLLMELDLATSQPMTERHLLALLRRGAIRRSLAETLLRALPADEVKLLGLRLTESPADLALLQSCLKDDPWITQTLPQLVDWLDLGRPAATLLSAPASVDAMIDLHHVAGPLIGRTLHSVARLAVSPRRMSAVMTKARNDGPYLLDWIAYHRAIGFDHIFIYSNDNDDGSDPLLEILARNGVITWIDSDIVSGTNPQDKANQHIFTMVPQLLDYRWLLIIDSDEYLGMSSKFDSINDYIGWQERRRVDAIGLCWLLFGATPTDGWSDAGTVDRFHARETIVNLHVKSLARTNRFWGAQPHFPYSTLGEPFAFRTESGTVHHIDGVTERTAAFAETPSAEYAWISHYIFRSCIEAVWRLGRGRADWDEETTALRDEYLNHLMRVVVHLANPANVIEDRRTQLRLPGRDRELTRLKEIIGVAACDTDIKRHFKKRLYRTAEAFLDRPAINTTHETFRTMVQSVLQAAREKGA